MIFFIEILIGLPGSGKTHYAKENGACVDDYWSGSIISTKVSYVNFDHRHYAGKNVNYVLNDKFAREIIEKPRLYKNYNVNHWIFDGLFLTNAAQRALILAIQQANKTNRHIKIQFVYFNEDRETCLFNDKQRNREELADITIKSATYEKPNINELKRDFPDMEFSIIEKEVHKMNVYECVFKPHESFSNKDKMQSDYWSRGGSWGDCWGNSGSISPDPQPSSFTEFDELLEEICPNITFLQYKKLYNECVTVEEDGHGDYYGGYEYTSYFQCDLKKLYEMMVEMNLIDLEKYE